MSSSQVAWEVKCTRWVGAGKDATIYDTITGMSLPRVAIVGRPNVGKSSLLNRISGRRISIVDPTPGVTRDRVTSVVEVPSPLQVGGDPILAEFVDTGGWGIYTVEGERIDDAGADLGQLTEQIEGQIQIAMEQAEIVIFVTDAQTGPTALDETVARLLRRHNRGKDVLVVANKVDSQRWEAHGIELAGLGLGSPLPVSATSGYCMPELLDAIWEKLQGMESDEPADPELKVAMVGTRNAGKSTLINTLAGEERVIVSEIAGTTRDAVDVRFTLKDRSFVAIDTAGLRKRKSFSGDVEYYAYHRMLQAIRRADVAILMIDASRDVTQVDRKLGQELVRQYKPTIIVVNKWDLVEDRLHPEDYLTYLTENLRGLEFAPIVFLSAIQGDGVEDLMAMAFNLHDQASHRESTGSLNAVISDILQRRGPSSRLGSQAKLFYASQLSTNPPTLSLVVNQPQLFEGRYERYLMNRIREELPYSEVPIRLVFSRRSRKSLAELKEGH
jgi:GTP-binding protein